MLLGKSVEELRVRDVIMGYPRSLLWTIPLPVNQELKTSYTAKGVEDLMDLVDGTVINLHT